MKDARVLALAAFATVAAFFLFRGTGNVRGPADVEDAVPHGAFLVATVDVAALRGSPLVDAVLGPDKNRALGTSAVAEACGFDPFARVGRAAIAVPEDESDRGAFGVAAKVDVTADELRRCVAQLSEKQGARATTHEVGSFVVLDRQKDAPSGKPPARIAYGRGGLLLVGQGGWLDAMRKAADREAPSVATDAAHAALRTALARADDPKTKTIALVSMVLPRGLRERLRREMAPEAEDSESAAMMRAVLAVSSAGLALRTHAPVDAVSARALFVCEDEESAVRLEKLYGKKRLDWSRDLALRLLGVGAIVDAIELKRDGARLEVGASAPAANVAAVLGRVLRLRGPAAAP